jgi:hypothetical protein
LEDIAAAMGVLEEARQSMSIGEIVRSLAQAPAISGKQSVDGQFMPQQ